MSELVGPDEGELAEGEWGVGRLAEPDEIAARVEQLLAPGSLAGRRVLITAGGTREPLDSVRFVGNRSSGRMGAALAEEARRRGAEVILLAANLSVDATAWCRDDSRPRLPNRCSPPRSPFPTSMSRCSRRQSRTIGRSSRSRASAPRTIGAGRSSSSRPPDVARSLGERRRPGQILVAFGAEHGEEGLERKRAMLDEKNVDLVVYNDVGRPDIGFDVGENEVVLVSRDGDRTVPKASKADVAGAILDEVERLLA